MSKTKRDKIKGRYKKADKKYDELVAKKQKKLIKQGYSWLSAYYISRNGIKKPWNQFTFEEQRKMFSGHGKNPSWWNKMYNISPRRRDDRDKLKKLDLKSECEGVVFNDDKKPCIYYW